MTSSLEEYGNTALIVDLHDIWTIAGKLNYKTIAEEFQPAVKMAFGYNFTPKKQKFVDALLSYGYHVEFRDSGDWASVIGYYLGSIEAETFVLGLINPMYFGAIQMLEKRARVLQLGLHIDIAKFRKM